MAKVIALAVVPYYNQIEKYNLLHPPDKVDIRWLPDERAWKNRLKCGGTDVGAYVCNTLITGSNPVRASDKTSKILNFRGFFV